MHIHVNNEDKSSSHIKGINLPINIQMKSDQRKLHPIIIKAIILNYQFSALTINLIKDPFLLETTYFTS